MPMYTAWQHHYVSSRRPPDCLPALAESGLQKESPDSRRRQATITSHRDNALTFAGIILDRIQLNVLLHMTLVLTARAHAQTGQG
jgi:hypothetical protein